MMELPPQIIKNLGLQVSAQPTETQSNGQIYEEGLYNKSMSNNRVADNRYARRQSQESAMDDESYDDRTDEYADSERTNDYGEVEPMKHDVFNHSSMGYSDNIVSGDLLSYDSQNRYGENDFNNRRVSVSDGTPNGDWWKMSNLLGNLGGGNFERRNSKPNVSPQSMFAYGSIPEPWNMPEVKKKDTDEDYGFHELPKEEASTVDDGAVYEVESNEEPVTSIRNEESPHYQNFDEIPDKKPSRFASNEEDTPSQPSKFTDKVKAIIPSRSEKVKPSVLEKTPMPRTLAEARGNPNYTTSDDWFDESNESTELDDEPENKAKAFYKPAHKSANHGFEVGVRKSNFEPYDTKNLESRNSFEDMFGFKASNDGGKSANKNNTLKQGNEDVFGFGGMGNGLTSEAIFGSSLGNNTGASDNSFNSLGGQSGLTFADTFGFSIGERAQHTRQITQRAPLQANNIPPRNNQIPRAPSFNRENVKTKVIVVKKVVQPQPQESIRSGSVENVMGRGFGSPMQPQQQQRPTKKGFFDGNSDYTSQFNKGSDLGFNMGGFSSNIFGNSAPKVIGTSRPMAVSNQPISKKSAKKIIKTPTPAPSAVSNKPFGSKLTIGDGSTLELPKVKGVSHKPVKKQKSKSKSVNKQTLKCNTGKLKTNVSTKKKNKSPKQSKPKQSNFDFGRLIWG